MSRPIEITEATVADYLRSIRPRPGYQAELLGVLTRASDHPHVPGDPMTSARFRWVVVGTIAGALSATGVAYLGVRRHRHRGVA